MSVLVSSLIEGCCSQGLGGLSAPDNRLLRQGVFQVALFGDQHLYFYPNCNPT